MNRWTVHVRNFGKIEEADVEIAPLTLFVGDNNSGKSYLMTLIYGILNEQFWMNGLCFKTDTSSYGHCQKILDEMMQVEDGGFYILEKDNLKQFECLMNEFFEVHKKKFLLRLFNREMNIGEISISLPEDMKLKFIIEHSFRGKNQQEGFSFRLVENSQQENLGCMVSKKQLEEKGEGYQFVLSYIMASILRGGQDTRNTKKSVYLPTTRTGFLLTYKTLVGRAVQEKFTLEKNDKNLLTKPNSDFLKELGSMDTAEERECFQKVIEFIENRVISGHISISDTPAQDVAYIPEESNQKLPLYVTSAVVTEMTPLLLFLKYVNVGTLLFEEPEISLHPQLQWQVGRVLVRLTNMGLPVFVTTHSDLILQHINNMIKANEIKNLKDFLERSDYEEEDLLSRENIRVFQFDVQKNGMTNVRRLPCGDFGFEAETFYDTLEKMNSEIEQIEKEA